MTSTLTHSRSTVSVDSGAPSQSLAGTTALVRFILRRDRIRILLWMSALVLITSGTAVGLPSLFGTEAERQSRAEFMASPAAIAMAGPGHGLDDYTFGAMLANERLGLTAIFVAIMSILMVIRHTRAEEEAGRAEIVRATVVGRYAHLAATLATTSAVNVFLAVLVAASLTAVRVESLDLTGSLTFGAALAIVGLVFAGVAAVTAQVTEHARGANGLAFAALAGAYALRAAGDLTESALSWFSPFGWAQASRAYVDERWWPLALAGAFSAALMATAFALSARRDVGAGLRSPRPGPAIASEALTRPLGFAARLHRDSLLGWGVGLFLLGAAFGSLAGEVEEIYASNPTMQDFLAAIDGAGVLDTWLGTLVSLLAIICGVYAVLATLRLRGEETVGRAEPLLAAALSRTRWICSHLTIVFAGATLMLALSGAGLGLSASIATGDSSLFVAAFGAAITYIPAVWLVSALAVALFGHMPRLIAATWLVIVYAVIVGMTGGLLQLPDWASNLSPFGVVPLLPADDFRILPLLMLFAFTVALVVAGLLGFRRRDLDAV